MAKSIGDIMSELARLQVKRDNIVRTRKQLFTKYSIKFNRIQAVENKLKIDQDLAFRQLTEAMEKEERIRKKVDFYEIFEDPGPIHLE